MLDVTVYAVLHLSVFALVIAFATAFRCAVYDPVDEKRKAMGWHAFFPTVIVFVLVMDAICMVIFCLPAHLVPEVRVERWRGVGSEVCGVKLSCRDWSWEMMCVWVGH